MKPRGHKQKKWITMSFNSLCLCPLSHTAKWILIYRKQSIVSVVTVLFISCCLGKGTLISLTPVNHGSYTICYMIFLFSKMLELNLVKWICLSIFAKTSHDAKVILRVIVWQTWSSWVDKADFNSTTIIMVRMFGSARCILNSYVFANGYQQKSILFSCHLCNDCLTESAMDSKLFLCALGQRLFDSTDRR